MAIFKIIATHPKPHLDEIAAIWLLRKFGKEKFPGIKHAEIQYWNETDITETPEKYESQGIVLLGIGNGKFDEHPGLENGRKENECCATLIAKYLDIDDDPALEKILKFVLNNDLKASAHPFDLAYVTNVLHRQSPNNPEKIIEWTTTGLEAKYQEQLQFFTATKKEFEKATKIEQIQCNGKTVNLVIAVSDDGQMSKFARSFHGCNAAIVIQKLSSGNVQIFSNKKFKITFYDVAQMLRLEEQKAKGKLITTDWKELATEGKVEGAEEWFFHKEGQLLLNGSFTAPNVPPTQISLKQITELVKIGVNRNQFYKNCDSRGCRNCPWYSWGLHRCRKLRFEKHSK